MQQCLFADMLKENKDEALSAKLSAIQAELSRIMLLSSKKVQCELRLTLEEFGVPEGRIHLKVAGKPVKGVDHPCAMQ